VSWTSEEVEHLKKLAESKTIPHIAAELGRSTGAVRWELRKMGLTTKVPWQRDHAEASRIVKYSNEHGCKSAADHYGITVAVVKGIRKRYSRAQQKKIEKADPEKLQRLRMSAIRYACTKGYAQDSEDFASHVLIQALHQPTVNLKWLLSGYLAETKGNYKTLKGAEKNSKERWQQHIEEYPDTESPNAGVQVGETPTDSMAILRALDGVVLTLQERACFVLSIQFGLRGIEIAMVLDVTHQRVQQILVAAVQKVAKKQRKDGNG